MNVKKAMPVLLLKFIGIDEFSCPVYKDQFDHLWKDIELGNSANPYLHSVTNDDPDGEPLAPIRQPYQFESAPYRTNPHHFEYAMLDRLRMDCEYFLGYGGRSVAVLYYHDIKTHIEHMKQLWNAFPEDEKPKWLPWEKILEYEKQMSEAIPN